MLIILQVISFVHTAMKNISSVIKTCLVVCPLNTVLNWVNEWERWLPKRDRAEVRTS